TRWSCECLRGARGVSVSFFFQAEDGIRDWSVTGVQTCALPISSALGSPGAQGPFPPAPATLRGRLRRAKRGRRERVGRRAREIRSEERRVGKERRSRGWPGH